MRAFIGTILAFLALNPTSVLARAKPSFSMSIMIGDLKADPPAGQKDLPKPSNESELECESHEEIFLYFEDYFAASEENDAPILVGIRGEDCFITYNDDSNERNLQDLAKIIDQLLASRRPDVGQSSSVEELELRLRAIYELSYYIGRVMIPQPLENANLGLHRLLVSEATPNVVKSEYEKSRRFWGRGKRVEKTLDAITPGQFLRPFPAGQLDVSSDLLPNAELHRPNDLYAYAHVSPENFYRRYLPTYAYLYEHPIFTSLREALFLDWMTLQYSSSNLAKFSFFEAGRYASALFTLSMAAGAATNIPSLRTILRMGRTAMTNPRQTVTRGSAYIASSTVATVGLAVPVGLAYLGFTKVEVIYFSGQMSPEDTERVTAFHAMATQYYEEYLRRKEAYDAFLARSDFPELRRFVSSHLPRKYLLFNDHWYTLDAMNRASYDPMIEDPNLMADHLIASWNIESDKERELIELGVQSPLFREFGWVSTSEVKNFDLVHPGESSEGILRRSVQGILHWLTGERASLNENEMKVYDGLFTSDVELVGSMGHEMWHAFLIFRLIQTKCDHHPQEKSYVKLYANEERLAGLANITIREQILGNSGRGLADRMNVFDPDVHTYHFGDRGSVGEKMFFESALLNSRLKSTHTYAAVCGGRMHTPGKSG